ncbi:PIN domain-containing protein [Streptomyces sp. NPDC127037]|uniref:PIN domain-containing protein n=1 Tax=Streptomyces sp. NPDC127037 TaxID=3347113 RepID=UPI0036591B99
MIILDTCILEKFALESTSTDLLKTIQTSGVDVVAVPDIVMMELTSHRVVPQREKHEKAVEAVENFAKTLPWPAAAPKPQLDLDRLADHWQKRFEEVVTVLPTSPEVLREGFRRESMALPPCKRVEASGGSHKVGGRDAAIWLTAVEYAREHPDETVVFVSENTTDFGNGTSYLYPMDGDVGKLNNFVHLTTFPELISRFATPDEVAEDVALNALTSAESRKAVLRAVRKSLGFSRLRSVVPFEVAIFRLGGIDPKEIAADNLQSYLAYGFGQEPSLKLDSVRDMKAHRIGNHVWCSVTARWLLSGLVLGKRLPRVGGPTLRAGTTWETRVLFSPTQEGAPLTVLRAWPPQCPSPAEFAKMPELPPWSEVESDLIDLLDRRAATERGSELVQLLLADIADEPLSELSDGELPYTGALARRAAIARRLNTLNHLRAHEAMQELDRDE